MEINHLNNVIVPSLTRDRRYYRPLISRRHLGQFVRDEIGHFVNTGIRCSLYSGSLRAES